MPYFLHFLHQCVADCNFPLKHFYHLSETKLRDFAPFHGRSVGRSVIDASGESFIPCFLYLCCSCESFAWDTPLYMCVCVRFSADGIYDFQTTSARSLAILSPAKPNFAVATSDCARCGSGMCISDRLGSLPFPRPFTRSTWSGIVWRCNKATNSGLAHLTRPDPVCLPAAGSGATITTRRLPANARLPAPGPLLGGKKYEANRKVCQIFLNNVRIARLLVFALPSFWFCFSLICSPQAPPSADL